METNTTTTVTEFHTMRVGQGVKLHVQAANAATGAPTAYTVCGAGNHGNYDLAMRLSLPRISGHPAFDTQADVAGYLAAFAPRNACKACLKAVS